MFDRRNVDEATATAIIEAAQGDDSCFEDTRWWLHNLLEGATDGTEAAEIIAAAVAPDSGVIMFSLETTLAIRSLAGS